MRCWHTTHRIIQGSGGYVVCRPGPKPVSFHETRAQARAWMDWLANVNHGTSTGISFEPKGTE